MCRIIESFLGGKAFGMLFFTIPVFFCLLLEMIASKNLFSYLKSCEVSL
jgi:hypothetical protein